MMKNTPSLFMLNAMKFFCWVLSLKDVVLTVIYFHYFTKTNEISDLLFSIMFLFLSFIFGNLGNKFHKKTIELKQ